MSAAPAYWSNVHPHAGSGFDADICDNVLGHKVRIVVRHDTAYAFQSYARVDVWNPASLSWNRIADYHFGAWAKCNGAEDGATVGLWMAVNELTARAIVILDTPRPEPQVHVTADRAAVEAAFVRAAAALAELDGQS